MASRLLRKLDGQVQVILDLIDDPHGLAKIAALFYADKAKHVDPKVAQAILDYYRPKVGPKPAKCVGHDGSGQWQCCARVGEYNGFGSGPTIFICPEGCSCHD